ncbi:MAG: sodium bicarbonate transporter family protein [Cyclobacteriaceae bacterium]
MGDFNHLSQEGLQWTGKPFGGIIQDIKRRTPHYLSDFKDGFSSKVAGTTFFMFFAALANAIAFGALTGTMTGNEIGITEMIVVTAIGGIAFALFSGQPLTILGGTGPIVIFTGLLYVACGQLNIAFLPTYAWVGIWSGFFMLILAFTDASALMRYFTRFTDEIFAALISVIFIVEAVKDVNSTFAVDDISHSTSFLTLILATGTFMISRWLKNMTKSPFLRRTLREFISDFGPSIAIIAMTFLAMSFPDVTLSRPLVPNEIGTTSGRPWLVDVFGIPVWAMFASAGPAILATILLFLDQNITTRLVNAAQNKLKKGPGYHLDLAVVGVIILVGSLFALPWIVAATVHSLNHVKSLADMKVTKTDQGKKEEISSVRENRVSGLTVHLLILTSLFFLGYVALIPMPVLFGLFLYMGVASLAGNQFFERMTLWVKDPKLYPEAHYLNIVPNKVVHQFTIIQFLCFVVLWVLKTSPAGILFPLFIAMLVPIRLFMAKFFKGEHLWALVKEDEEEEEELGIVI